MTSRASTANWVTQMLDRFDEMPKGARIALMVLGFIVFWPIGLAILGYLIWSGEMGCSRKQGRSHFKGWGRSHGGHRRSSGNQAFDEYREATLRQLEEDQREFNGFVEQLRRAKDQQEFDSFMSDRMRRKQEENGSEKRPEENQNPS